MGIWASVDFDVEGIETGHNDHCMDWAVVPNTHYVGVATATPWHDRIRLDIFDIETSCLGTEIAIDREGARRLMVALAEAINRIDASEAETAARKARQR